MTSAPDPEWPGSPAVVVLARRHGVVERLESYGDLAERREWASVSKMAVGLAAALEVDRGERRYDDVVDAGPITLAHLLSHSSGLGLEEGDPVRAPESRRVYSNCAIDRAAAFVAGDRVAPWLDERVFGPLAMGSTRLEGRAASDVVGSTDDLASFAAAWLRGAGLSNATRERLTTPYLATLDGIVPGFGRFTPCPWGLGPEIRGAKEHWMGDWPPESFGHFGLSGALVLVDPLVEVAVVATSTVAFGPWARALWPQWISAVHRRAIS